MSRPYIESRRKGGVFRYIRPRIYHHVANRVSGAFIQLNNHGVPYLGDSS